MLIYKNEKTHSHNHSVHISSILTKLEWNCHFWWFGWKGRSSFYKKFSIFSPLDFLYPFTGEISGLKSGSFKNAKREGIWVSYHKNGNIGIKEIYKDGKRDGFYEMYYENGQLLDKGKYKDGSRDGLWETYYESGQL